MRFLIVCLCFLMYLEVGAQRNYSWFKRTHYNEPRFSVTLGLNAVDIDANKSLFGVFRNPGYMALSKPLALNFEYRFSDWISLNLGVNQNKWKAFKGRIGGIQLVSDTNYFSADLGPNIFISELFYKKVRFKPIELYLSPNIGYFHIDSDAYTYNLGIGIIIRHNYRFSTHLRAQAKFIFQSDDSEFNQNHQQFYAGFSYRF